MLNIKKYKQIEMKFKALIDQSISTKSFNLFQYKQLIENEDPLYIITIIRKNGFFRPSKYDYETYIIDHLYGLIQEDKKYLDFKNYLQSVENLKNLSREIKKTHVKLKKYISSRKSLLKYFLAKADDI